jgi:phosphoglycerate dehydrogenase-like enzyme
VWYHKRVPYEPEVEQVLDIRGVSFGHCVREADVLVNLLPFTSDTAKCFGEAQFDAMSPQAVLVHAGSGGVIDEGALIFALARGRIAGAALDTYELEPLPPDHPLVALAREGHTNLLLTPHVASGTLASSRADDFAEVLRFLRGEPLRFEVNHA